MKVVIIIPSYNEAESVPQMVETLSGILPTISDHDMQVLYVDDTSPDGTAGIVRSFQKKYPWLHLLVNPKKEGLGVAYAAGMAYAMKELKADWIMEFDADFQHPPKDIPRLVAEINNGYDYIVASRYIPGGSIPDNWSFGRKFLSVVGNLVARVLLILPNVHDVTGGFKLSRVKGFMDEFDFDTLLSKRFAYKVHLFVYMVQKGAKIKEVPFAFGNREKGESKIIKNELQETLRVIFWLQALNPKIQRLFKFGVVGFSGYLINALTLQLFTKLTFPGWAAWFFSTELAIVSNFTWNNVWTFRDQKISGPLNLLIKFFQFNLSSAGGLIITVLVGLASDHLFGAQFRQIALPLSIVFLVLPYNYFVYNRFIWKTTKTVPNRQ